jgi:hypothetical protein
MAVGLLLWLLGAMSGPAPPPEGATEILYEALHGDPQVVEARVLLAEPGLFVGHAVRTRGRLARSDGSSFALAVGESRALLRLEPAAAALVATHASSWEGRTVDVVGFFYREAAPVSAYALRAWSVWPPGESPPAEGSPASEALSLPLEQLVYGAHRYDGRLVRVRGTYRGSNRQADLPEATRRGPHDWVLKDGYFAAWVTGREARGDGWDLTRQSREDTGTTLDVVGVSTFAGGVIRIAAREVRISPTPTAVVTSRGLGGDTTGRGPSGPPHLSFAYPIAGEPLRARGQMILQFSRSMDPTRFESGVRVRYERAGAVTGTPSVRFDYVDRYRALVLTPAAPPPPGAVVVVELRDTLIDVDGRGLVGPPSPEGPAGSAAAGSVVERVSFRAGR